MPFAPSPALVRRSLSSHSWLGLLAGFLMYLICLSGALIVFVHEFERWEQPDVPEFTAYDPAMVARAYGTVMAGGVGDTHHMYVLLPTEEMPRLLIASDTEGWAVNPDGTIAGAVSHEWTHLLEHLHVYLHLPSTLGLIVVGALGAMLCGLIVSGFVAHPRIFKDAFALRLRGSRQLEQADLHNRLSVWGAPFHLVIAVTGAYFGVATLLLPLFAGTYFGGDTEKAMAAVFGAEPALEQPPGPLGIDRALAAMPAIAPGTRPFYVTVEDVGTPQQYMIVGAQHPDRLIYAEQYRFDSTGAYLGPAGFADGEAGKQVLFSVYRVHFGHFGGLPVKIVYALFGLALTVVSVTGVNLWLVKRRRRDAWNNVWAGAVWGAPLALALTALLSLGTGIASVALFWGTLLATAGLAQWWDDEARTRARLLLASGSAILLVVLAHGLRFGGDALTGAALGVNLTLLAIAAGLLLTGLRLRGARRPAAATVSAQGA
ncbi:PepSY-associated TM helix domain-containing protein [Rhodocista pekingensis]|uniref:PepSY-associated TM helix domain-containing protein n=1 Tax=Rhodocista pekingensis TaxID=201185 RepID=A0ABW2L0Z6_9PROT